jgi:pimeloyl-ACP methyl ester carboxylesterase
MFRYPTSAAGYREVFARQLARWLVCLVTTCPVLAGTVSAAAQEKEEKQPLPPEKVAIETTDRVVLAATYYPSEEGKSAPALILLHGDGGQRSDLEHLALLLQAAGNAVIAPDLRGHGESLGEFKNLRLEDYEAMVRRDLEAVKGFLMQEHNAGRLNIERLGLVGVEMGASLALNWAALDWSWPELATGKQGQDVKALVLISPEWGHKGLRISDAVVHPDVRSQISMLIVCGRRNAKLLGESKRLYNSLARYHDVSAPAERQTLFLHTPATSLQGIRLINDGSLDVESTIVGFVDLRLRKPALGWQVRKAPL